MDRSMHLVTFLVTCLQQAEKSWAGLELLSLVAYFSKYLQLPKLVQPVEDHVLLHRSEHFRIKTLYVINIKNTAKYTLNGLWPLSTRRKGQPYVSIAEGAQLLLGRALLVPSPALNNLTQHSRCLVLPAPCLQGMSHPVVCSCPIAHFLKILWQVKETAPKAAQPRAQVTPRPPTPLFSAWPSLCSVGFWVPENKQPEHRGQRADQVLQSWEGAQLLGGWVPGTHMMYSTPFAMNNLPLLTKD